MSMPVFPDTDIEREQALTLVLASIAYEELALSHLINAEGEKIQAALGTLVEGQGAYATTFQQLLDINLSVANMLSTVQTMQENLMTKMTAALDADTGGGAPV